MHLNRFIGNFDFSNAHGLLEIKDAGTIRQITRVLRLGAGDSVILGDGNGREFVAEIKKIDRQKIYLLLRKENGTEIKESRTVTLYSAILKRENFELVVQKATEIGVSEIVPVLTERTVKKRVRTDRLADIAREASEQSGRRFIPKIREPIPFSQALDEIETGDYAVFFDPMGASFSAKTPNNTGHIRIYIGPEEGWTEKEKNLAQEKGSLILRLGTRILRSETAAIVGLYQILHSFEGENPVE